MRNKLREKGGGCELDLLLKRLLLRNPRPPQAIGVNARAAGIL